MIRRRPFISRATRRQLALTFTVLAMIGALFGSLAYGAFTGDLVPFAVAAVLVGLAVAVFAVVPNGSD